MDITKGTLSVIKADGSTDYNHFQGERTLLKRFTQFPLIYATFTRNGFDDHERNLTFVKTDFQVLILDFHACDFK